eukprot:297650-Rhodomonas_salina.3
MHSHALCFWFALARTGLSGLRVPSRGGCDDVWCGDVRHVPVNHRKSNGLCAMTEGVPASRCAPPAQLLKTSALASAHHARYAITETDFADKAACKMH